MTDETPAPTLTLTGALLPSRGAAASLTMTIVRELEEADLSRLVRGSRHYLSPLKKIRAIHRRQAQLIAEGLKYTEVAAIVGSTPQRIHQLMQDISFQELVAYYEDQTMIQRMEDGARLRGKLVDVAEMAVDELADRLEDDSARAKITTNQLRLLAETGLDRTVAPPKSTTAIVSTPATVTLNFGRELNPAETLTTIEGDVTDVEPEPSPEPESRD